MAQRALKPCKRPGCPSLVQLGYCIDHQHIQKKTDRETDRRRGTAYERGYNNRWRKYSKWFLKQHGNQLCKLKLDDGCAYISECVDHINPPDGPNDPKFWDKKNHQAACIHCNSVKGHRTIKGD